jgi:hypothetical protein
MQRGGETIVIKTQGAIKIAGLLAIVCLMAAFGMGCTCFNEATAEPPKAVAAPPPPPPPVAKSNCDCSVVEAAAKRAEAAAGLAEAAAKKAEMAAQRAEAAAERAEKAAEKAEAAANKAEAVFMKKMKK